MDSLTVRSSPRAGERGTNARAAPGAEGADVILTGRNPERLQQAAFELDAQSTAAVAAAWVS
jgi:NADP-dependent 3-hydroxy acid dehydrogenase YdfG